MAANKQTETQIIDGALLYLQQVGPARPPYAGIAASSGVSRQLVRYYFPDPDQIVLDTCDAASKVYADALAQRLEDSTSGDRLSYLLDFFFGTTAQHERQISERCFDALLALSIGSDALRGSLAEKYKALGHALQGEIRAAHPSLSEAAVAEIGFCCVSLLKGHWSMVETLGFSRHHNKMARGTMDRMIKSYLADPTPIGDAGMVWSKD